MIKKNEYIIIFTTTTKINKSITHSLSLAQQQKATQICLIKAKNEEKYCSPPRPKHFSLTCLIAHQCVLSIERNALEEKIGKEKKVKREEKKSKSKAYEQLSMVDGYDRNRKKQIKKNEYKSH